MQYTLVITSCGRPTLLQQTITSFLASADVQPREIIVVDDSGMERPDWFARHNVTWLTYQHRGQIFCIDEAYARVKTDWIFHCEDDWVFCNTGYIEKSREILEQYPDILQVWLRGIPTPYELRNSWFIYNVEPHAKHPELQSPRYHWGGWRGGFSFNPGLRRLVDYRRIGSYGRHCGYDPRGCGERATGRLYDSLGLSAAILPDRYLYHIGDESHVDRKQNPDASKILLAVPTAESLDYSRFRQMQLKTWGRVWPGGVSGLQHDGPNARRQAVLDTWWKDTEAHKNLTAKMFTGQELGCGDSHVEMPQKMRRICQWAVERGVDKMFRCDDDTYVHVDRLVRQGIEWDGDYAGVAQGDMIFGGCGIWMSRRAMEIVAAAEVPAWDSEWRDDAWMGQVLRDHGIKPGNDLPGLSDELPGLQRITYHPVAPDDMRTRYAGLCPLWKEDPNDLT